MLSIHWPDISSPKFEKRPDKSLAMLLNNLSDFRVLGWRICIILTSTFADRDFPVSMPCLSVLYIEFFFVPLLHSRTLNKSCCGSSTKIELVLVPVPKSEGAY